MLDFRRQHDHEVVNSNYFFHNVVLSASEEMLYSKHFVEKENMCCLDRGAGDALRWKLSHSYYP